MNSYRHIYKYTYTIVVVPNSIFAARGAHKIGLAFLFCRGVFTWPLLLLDQPTAVAWLGAFSSSLSWPTATGRNLRSCVELPSAPVGRSVGRPPRTTPPPFSFLLRTSSLPSPQNENAAIARSVGQSQPLPASFLPGAETISRPVLFLARLVQAKVAAPRHGQPVACN